MYPDTLTGLTLRKDTTHTMPMSSSLNCGFDAWSGSGFGFWPICGDFFGICSGVTHLLGVAWFT